MSVSDFLLDLQTEGRVRVPRFSSEAGDPFEGLEEAVALLDERVREDVAGSPASAPELSVAAAAWGAWILYRAVGFHVHPGAPTSEIETVLLERCPHELDASTAYSVDLSLRWLPDLDTLVRRGSGDSPLPPVLAELGARWPLSSIGMALEHEPEPAALEITLQHPTLRAETVDRVIERRDWSRLDDPRVRTGVRAALGHDPEVTA